MTVADLWLCWGCHIPHLNVGPERVCSHCGAGLEYMGELTYQDKDLVSGEAEASA